MNASQDAEFLREYKRNLELLIRYKSIGAMVLASPIEERLYAADKAVEGGSGMSMALADLRKSR